MLASLLALWLLAQESPHEAELPEGWNPDTPIQLVSADGRILPCQPTGKRSIVFLAKDEAAELTVQPITGWPRPHAVYSAENRVIQLLNKSKPVLQYNGEPVPQPDPLFTRSGYFHPVWTPAGRIVTNDSPPNHLHHHGIWSAWTSSEFEGRKSNFWESKEKQGRVECIEASPQAAGPIYSGLKARHRFVNLNAPGGEKVALEEMWEVRAYALPDRNVFDLVSTQTCATDLPLVIKEYRYGGIGFRGAADWEGKNGVKFLTSEGKTRIDGHATKAKWCIAFGKVGEAECSIAFLCHPSNFRAPQPMRIHPDEPFFNWAVPQGGDFSIEPGKPYVARYRFIVADGVLTQEEIEAAWKAYAEPARITLKAAK